VTIPAATAIISDGEQGDSCYPIMDGTVRVTKGRGEIRRLVSGDGFGEIALLHPVTRAATVTATSERDDAPEHRPRRLHSAFSPPDLDALLPLYHRECEWCMGWISGDDGDRRVSGAQRTA
jgi:hypothetical protein